MNHAPSLPSPVLVTGAAGFIGSHLVERCIGLGLQVRAFVRYNSSGTAGWLERSPMRGDIEIISGDVRDFDSVQRAMQGCRSVLHLAALIGIPYSYLSPLAYVRTNIEGTYNVLEAARLLGLERVAVTSTSETYGTAQYAPIDERHPAVGQSPYAASKIGADQLAISYHRSFALPVVIVRPFNTYGPRQSARAIVPAVATQILAGQRTVRLGNLSPTRDLTFVRDVVEGYLAASACDELVGEAVNIGRGDEISIGKLAERIAHIIGGEVKIEADPERARRAASEVERLICDSSKLRKLTGWSPQVSLDDGLRETIDWLRENLERYRPESYQV